MTVSVPRVATSLSSKLALPTRGTKYRILEQLVRSDRGKEKKGTGCSPPYLSEPQPEQQQLFSTCSTWMAKEHGTMKDMKDT